MLFHIGFRCLPGGVVAAGQMLGDGNAENILGIAEGLQPFAYVGAGGAGFSLIALQILHHLSHVQPGGIHIFLSGYNLHGYAAVILVGNAQHIGGGVCNNSKFHD